MRPDPEERSDDEREARIARRVLLGGVGVAALGGIGAAVLGATGRAASPLAAAASTPSPSPRVTPSVAPRPSAATTTHLDHDKIAEAKVKAFPAKTAGRGMLDLESRMIAGVREFELTAAPVDWEVTPGQKVRALAFNGQVPGPTIRAGEGEPVRIVVHNRLGETTGIHWHGLRVPNGMDGVPFITQPPIPDGGTFTYEFTAGPFGSHMYHSHHNATDQVGRGLLGAFLVAPRDPAKEPAYDRDELFILNDQLGGFTVGGKGFPATSAYEAKLGERVRFRFMNEGGMTHPVHLHGMAMEVFARDGYPLPQPFLCDTLTVGPGERWDAIVHADVPGVWAFHCHVLSHAEGPTGMFGMVTALIVT